MIVEFDCGKMGIAGKFWRYWLDGEIYSKVSSSDYTIYLCSNKLETCIFYS